MFTFVCVINTFPLCRCTHWPVHYTYYTTFIFTSTPWQLKTNLQWDPLLLCYPRPCSSLTGVFFFTCAWLTHRLVIHFGHTYSCQKNGFTVSGGSEPYTQGVVNQKWDLIHSWLMLQTGIYWEDDVHCMWWGTIKKTETDLQEILLVQDLIKILKCTFRIANFRYKLCYI